MAERPQHLTVWMDGAAVATISQAAGGRLQVSYRSEAMERFPRNTPLLSCSLPMQPRALDGTNFFDGVLPESPFRAQLAARADVAASDTYGLLARYGRDVAGALVITPDDAEPVGSGHGVVELSDEDLADEIRSLPERPLGIHDDSELSLAGLQDKMLLVALGPGRWGRPTGGAPSTHILKLDHRVHVGLVDAEADALRLARAAGLTNVDVETVTSGGMRCLIVSRFDRLTDAAGTVTRLHQEDMCQALGLAPTVKYELRQGGGGPEFEHVAGLLDRFASDAPAELDRLAAIAAFTAIIGNADGHGKNLALLHDGSGSVRLAPLYDTVPAALWPALTREAAMTVGGAVALDAVDRKAIEREALRWRYDPARAALAAESVAVALLDALDGAIIDPDCNLAVLVRSRAARFIA